MNWIVVADSDVSVLQAAGQILCRRGMRITGFNSARKLLDFLEENRPDLILLGDLPWETGGFEAADLPKQAAGLPVVLMLDREGPDPEAQVPPSGASGVVFKPLRDEQLTGRILEILPPGEESGTPGQPEALPVISSLEEIASSFAKSNETSNGLWMGREAFNNVYRHMLRSLERYHGIAFQVLFTVEMPNDVSDAGCAEIMAQFRSLLQHTLRDGDIMLESSRNQVFLLLPEVRDKDMGSIIFRIISKWKQTEFGASTEIISEVRKAAIESKEEGSGNQNGDGWVIVVDDDVANLKIAGQILSKQHMRVTALKSGQSLLDFLKDNHPDLILLDIRMPGMDGFETLRRLRQESTSGNEIPVIFLTADENAEAETEGLLLGAMDFIKKPFVPEVLSLRVKHIIQLNRLQKNLEEEVEIKTQENENLSLRIVQTLAEAIDAKDTYTNGHSSRVAKYSREIARRYGYSQKQQDEIYMIGLLHDVGKIGIPDAVINKPDALTAEEYAQVKTHAPLGDRILKNIKERPMLAVGARWHHERFDGTGYPDGLAGYDIPETARIIAVADAYDAMTSKRSYRGILPQEKVRSELIKGKGVQFDPHFADIMLQMMNEDPDYRMKEN